MEYQYKYPHPAVTADCVLFGSDAGGLSVLLVERAQDPFKGRWAFPGGFMNIDETAEQCAARELEEETGVKAVPMEQLLTVSTVNRDPRERVISVVFFAVVDRAGCKIRAGDDAHDVRWFPIDGIPPLAFDHDEILRVAVSRLGKLRITNCDPEP